MAIFPQRLLRLAVTALGVFVINLAPAQAANVLLLADDMTPGTAALIKAFETAGHQVTTVTPEFKWDGYTPSLTGIDVVVHLNGATWVDPLPVSAQQALQAFVENGGAYVGGQWNGFERVKNFQAEMDDLVLQNWGTSSTECSNACKVTYTAVDGHGTHPLLAGLPSSFTFFADGHGDYALNEFEYDAPTVLMTTDSRMPGVIVRDFGKGRVVNFSIAPNDGSSETLQDLNILQLYLNAVAWGADKSNQAPTAEATVDQATMEATSADGATFTLDASKSADPEGESLTYEWTGPMGTASGQRVTIVLPPPVLDQSVVEHTVTLTVADPRGASASTTLTLTVTDTTAPVIVGIPGPIDVEATSPEGAPVPFGSIEADDAVDGRRHVSCSHSAGATFPLGVTDVTCESGDGHGNTIKSSFTVTVRDTTKPKLSVPPSPPVVEATSPAGASVSFTVDATDLVDPNVSINCSAASGSTFTLGVTNVDCTATDDSGNATTERFAVTVRDTTPPVIGRITPNKTYLWSPNHVLVDVALGYTVTDAVSSPTCQATVSSDEAVDADGDGSTDVDWAVIDANLVRLRAERDGSGDGRIYTITVTCADADRNKSTAATSVYVQKSQSK